MCEYASLFTCAFFHSLFGLSLVSRTLTFRLVVFAMEGRNDLEGLVQFLTMVRQDNLRLGEVTYVINGFTFGGIIPLTHHGLIFKITGPRTLGMFLTLDFTSDGISWDVMDDFPELPDFTFHSETYKLDQDTSTLQKYCEETGLAIRVPRQN